jgi:hypothetical protein
VHTRTPVVFAILLLAIAGAAGAQSQQPQMGVHFGYQLESDGAFVGAQLQFPIAGSFELYPSIDYYFVGDDGVLGANADIVFRRPFDAFYIGGGLSLLKADTRAETGVSVFGGFRSRAAGGILPYVELRALWHGNALFQMTTGFAFRLN